MSGTMLLLVAIVFNVGANLMFRHASAIPNYPPQKLVLLGIGLLVGLINTLFYIRSLDELPLGTAFPIYSAVSIVLIAVLAGMIFGETWSLQKAAGLATICIGIVVFGRA